MSSSWLGTSSPWPAESSRIANCRARSPAVSAKPTSNCWAPSCRFRSRATRPASAAATSARDRARTSLRRASARAVARSFAARAAMALTARSANNGGTGVDASTSRQAVISPVPSNTGNDRRSGPMSSRPAPPLSIQPPPGARYRTLAVGSPTMAAAAAIVGDPTARVRYRAPGGGWIDSAGAGLEDIGPERRSLPVFDGTGEMTACLEVDASTPVPPLLADLAVSAIAARAANERATALADARRRDVRARSRALVAAADAGRVALERNLHDGAQQLLVGLALTAGLRARQFAIREDSAGQGDEVPSQDDDISEILDLVDSTAPAALSPGLADALQSLAAVCPIATTFSVTDDLPGDDPLALGLYLAAGEAITNAVKHSRAIGLRLSLVVTDDRVRMVLQDNGIGGVTQVPPSISNRIAGMAGRAEVESQVGSGTVLRIQVLRSRIGGGPK